MLSKRPTRAAEPPWQLKGFEKIFLKPGESDEIAVTLAAEAFSAWDERAHAWKTYPGTCTVSVGSSLRDIRGKTSLAISR